VWELIGNYSLRWPSVAIDGSPWRCDASPSPSLNLAPDGVGFRFTGSQDSVSIKRTDGGPWRELGGIRVEATVRLSSFRGYLIDGGDSFSMHLASGLLICSGFGRDVINTYDAPQDIPLGQWVKLTFEHNGFNRMQILIDGRVAATRGVINAVPGVGPQGVAIGNALATNNGYFLGDIDSVIIWRIDPRTMEKEFFARPLTPALADCWAEFFRSLREALRNNPECGRWLVNALDQLIKAFRHALAQKSPAKLKELADMHDAYRSLWRAGKIDDPQMKSLAKRLRAWLEAEGLIDRNDPALLHIVENPCFKLLLAQLSPLSCDPQSVALLQALAEDGQGTRRAAGRSSPTVLEVFRWLVRRLSSWR
jgi:hypothetical protein